MTARKRDVAKFFAGVAASETIGHWVMGIWGTHLYPIKLFGISFTQELNWFAMALWPVVLVFCVYVGWGKRTASPTPLVETPVR